MKAIANFVKLEPVLGGYLLADMMMIGKKEDESYEVLNHGHKSPHKMVTYQLGGPSALEVHEAQIYSCGKRTTTNYSPNRQAQNTTTYIG